MELSQKNRTKGVLHRIMTSKKKVDFVEDPKKLDCLFPRELDDLNGFL